MVSGPCGNARQILRHGLAGQRPPSGVILFMLLMGVYMYVRLRKLMQEKPGKTGWN